MNSTNSSAQPRAQPPLGSLIRPEQIPTLPHFPEHQKEKYTSGITRLWETIDSQPQGSPEYQAAYNKLIEVSLNIRNSMKKNQADQAAAQATNASQQNGARPTSSGQQGQQEARLLQPQHIPSGNQSQGPGQFSQKVIQKVRELDIIPTPEIAAQGPESVKQWKAKMQNNYAQQLHRLELSVNKSSELRQMAQQRASSGRDFSDREKESVHTQLIRLDQNQKEIKEYLSKLLAQQHSLKNQQLQAKPVNAENGSFDPSRAPNSQGVKQEPNSGMQHLSHITQEPLNQPHTVSSALDAARNQVSQAARSAISPQNNGPSGQPAMTQPPNPRPQPNQGQMPNSTLHPSLNTSTNSRPPEQQNHSPHVAPSHSTSMLSATQEPKPLSHQAAMEQARSYSHPNIQQSTPLSASHGHPTHDQQSQHKPQNNHAKMPIPKDLNLQPTQPVAMGPSRPTLTNGPVSMGPMGQPAIQRHPGYVLEGEGERVLSKKKLEELVRQVTGGTGGEGEESEGLTAEVEETLLQVADDFVDQVVVAACRLAKLRQSSTLELRDLQLILERNYNIRVPGYASDELRTVKKIQPTPGWTQKLSAVQAAKVTGGKGDL